ncbi:MAG: YraN family protein [Pseudomonadota bacterium]|nr:YraN family protein [Pseudomonadota bacterium]
MPPPRALTSAGEPTRQPRTVTRKSLGDAAEMRALEHLARHGLTLLQRNYRVARGPRARGGEVDLIMRAGDGTVVFVEVRARAGRDFGGAAASIGFAKRASLVYAAQCYLRGLRAEPPCRFDVVAIDGDRLEWLPAAFDAG